ncbi:MAG TPA: hypothetical protein PKD09_15545 [Aggregatilinea sp.]|nr:hypothetical protein [Aggregatilinea sp.]HML23067.1 hypothetical protein [Aggregatilinea sp.]
MNHQPMIHMTGTQVYISGWRYWLGCLKPLVLFVMMIVVVKVAIFVL